MPPATVGENGDQRRVGIELEFGTLTCEESARRLRNGLGGRLVSEDEHFYRVIGSELGDLTVKLDTRYAHGGDADGNWVDKFKSFLSSVAGSAASRVIPAELITTPLPLQMLPEFERAIDILRKAGASGTNEDPLFAFGLHLNPETPSRKADEIVAIMKAFVVLDEWLREALRPKPLRRALRFAEPYPGEYRMRLADPDYWPDQAGMIDDYIDANPTRNRDLDMLPLFRDLDEGLVTARLPDEKIGRRPAFHYRLPGDQLGDPEWDFRSVWNTWVAVETLAADPQRLRAVSEAYRRFQGTDEEWASASAELAFGSERMEP